MGSNKSLLQKATTLSAALFLGLATTPALNLTARAEVFQPPNRGAPPSTAEGGSRGCSALKPGEKPLTALTPANHMALTVSEHPTFFWYVPESGASNLEFTLLDENDQEVLYKTTVNVSKTPGIVSISLPKSTAKPLEVGKQYHWYLTSICDASDRTGDVFIDGWVERIEPTADLKAALESATPDTLPAVYARAGIWHEAIASLAALREQNPSDTTILARWEELLDSAKLNQFSEYPLISAQKADN